MQDTFSQMIRVGWARPDALFRRVFTNMMIPDATEEQMRWIDELQRISTSTEALLAARLERVKTDVTGLLPELDVPTLVLHSRRRADDRLSRGPRAGVLDTGARLVPLDSANHILLADEPAWQVFKDRVAAFLAAGPRRARRRPPRGGVADGRASATSCGSPPRASTTPPSPSA
jgi:pimeloyl-ACP methyl ester carboxylesterase